MKNESFDRLASAFNTEYIETSAIDNELQVIGDKKNELTNVIKSKNEITLEDKEYIETELKYLIAKNKNILDTLSEEIRVGANARFYEVYAKLSDSIVNSLRELREMNKVIYDMNLMKNGFQAQDNEDSNKNLFTANQMLEMIKSAKDNSQLNKIDATFEIIDSKE